MNKSVNTIVTVAGVVLIGYGIYTLIMPEASVDLGVIKAEVQDNTNAYVAIGLGIAALALTFLSRKKA